MKSLLGRAEFKSSEIHDVGSYSQVAAEYYDLSLHPTCADFREASKSYLKRLFAENELKGHVADIGCGRSLIAEFGLADCVLIDGSQEMLAQNDDRYEKRHLDVETTSFGMSEFSWIFAVLGDPYNSASAWANISKALQRSGECVFIVPSHMWTLKFRDSVSSERDGFARFVLADQSSVFLPSKVYSPQTQCDLILKSGLQLKAFDQVLVRELPTIKSEKVARFVSGNDPILDIYRASKE